MKRHSITCKSEIMLTIYLKWVSQVAPVAKNPTASAGDTGDAGLIPGSGGSPEEENGNPHQYSCLGNLMDRGVWWATVHGVAKSWMHVSARLRTHNPPPT